MKSKVMKLLVWLSSVLFMSVCGAQSPQTSPYHWTTFVQTAGQPEPVPAEWVSTPEGKFAHSIVVPKPVPKDSGYRAGMTSQQYFDHLCNSEAGDFISETVERVEGLYFMRPPKRPTDDDLKDRYKLEAPEIERTFQLRPATPEDRARIFINPPWANYSFVEEASSEKQATPYTRAIGYRQDISPMRLETVANLKSRYALIWRGLKRPHDRELAIAGSEWIVIESSTKRVLAVERNYARTGFNRNTKEGIWWLNASNCPNVTPRDNSSARFYTFTAKSLKPFSGDQK